MRQFESGVLNTTSFCPSPHFLYILNGGGLLVASSVRSCVIRGNRVPLTGNMTPSKRQKSYNLTKGKRAFYARGWPKAGPEKDVFGKKKEAAFAGKNARGYMRSETWRRRFGASELVKKVRLFTDWRGEFNHRCSETGLGRSWAVFGGGTSCRN